MEAQIALEIARSQASSHTSPSALRAGSRARADATQLHDIASLQVVQSEPLLPITLQTTADVAGPTGANGILPTNVNMDEFAAAGDHERPSFNSRADKGSSQAVRSHSGNQSWSGRFGPKPPLRHATSQPVSFHLSVQPCAAAPGTPENVQGSNCPQGAAAEPSTITTAFLILDQGALEFWAALFNHPPPMLSRI